VELVRTAIGGRGRRRAAHHEEESHEQQSLSLGPPFAHPQSQTQRLCFCLVVLSVRSWWELQRDHEGPIYKCTEQLKVNDWLVLGWPCFWSFWQPRLILCSCVSNCKLVYLFYPKLNLTNFSQVYRKIYLHLCSPERCVSRSSAIHLLLDEIHVKSCSRKNTIKWIHYQNIFIVLQIFQPWSRMSTHT